MDFLRWLLGRGISKSWDLPSFYENPDWTPKVSPQIKKRLDTLKRLSQKVIDDLLPEQNPDGEIVKTFCNMAVDRLARGVWGFSGFNAMVANGMYHRMKNAPDFAEVDSNSAQKLANDGRMVIAAIKDEPHGHVAVCVPGKTVYSGSWRCNAPMICNVGKRNGIMGANFAFRTVPTFFCWIEDEKETT